MVSGWTSTPAKTPNIQSKDNYDLVAADRVFSAEEEEAEKNSVKYPIHKFKRIKPIPGTLGYLFRNLTGRNDAVIEHLSNLIGLQAGGKYNKIKTIVSFWNGIDDFSRKRVDIFDWICIELSINRSVFWGWFQEACFNYDNVLAQTALSGHKNKFVEQLKVHANQPRNQTDRRLLAEAMKLTENQAPKIDVKVEDNSRTTNVNMQVHHKVPSFVKSIRASEIAEEKKVRELEAASTEFIDVKVVTKDEEKVLIRR